VINCIVRRRRTRVRFRTFALVRTSTTGIGEGDSTRTIPRQQILAHPTCPCLPARVLGRHWRGVHLLRPSLPPVRGARLVSKATLIAFAESVGLAMKKFSIGMDQPPVDSLAQVVSRKLRHVASRKSLGPATRLLCRTQMGDSRSQEILKERDRHKLAEFCHAYRQRHSTELLESWRDTVTPNLREKAVSALYSFAGLLTFLLGSCLILALPLLIRVTSLFIVGSGNAT